MTQNLWAAIAILVVFTISGMDVLAVEHDPVLYKYYEEPVSVVYNLTPTERALVEQVVACEAGADSEDGQKMIAQCLLDYAVDHDITVTDACNALQISTYNRAVTEANSAAVSAVFDDGERVTESHAYYWYQPAVCNGSWHETQRFVWQSDVSGHKFFGRW